MVERRLVLTGDFLRPFPMPSGWESATWKNIRWLDGIVGTAARLAGFEVSTVSWDERLGVDAGYFDTPAAYRALGLPLSTDGWAHLAGLAEIDAELADALLAPFRDSLVVGYEMPDLLLALLDEAGIAVVDLVLHPLRFLDDLVFALRTNRPEIHALLLANELDAELPALSAGRIRSKAAWMAPPLPLSPGTVLILGQVARDRAALDAETGRFAHLGEHGAELLDLVTGASMALFKPHPYDQAASPSQVAMRAFGSVQRTEANLYHLLAQDEVEAVVALNSSGLDEAAVFGKRAVWLRPPLYAFGRTSPGPAGGFGEAVPQDGAWTEPAFWRLLAAGTAQPVSPISGMPRPNRLRKSMNADWGFGAIDRILA